MDKFIEAINTFASVYLIKVVAAILIFLIGMWLSRKISKIIARIIKKQNVDMTLVGFLQSLSYFTLLTIVIMAAIAQLGINITSFMAILGAAGLAVGLALKDSLSNFASGVMLAIFRPFKVGDFVTAGGATGSIEKITIFNTIMNTPDNQRIIVPNGNITSNLITNVTANETRRVDLVIGISYDDNIGKAKEILERILNSEEKLLKDPPYTIAVSELADSSVNIVVRPWVNTGDYWAVYFALTEKIKTTFDSEGISIPYPQSDVHLFNENTNGTK
jgi:small conductance mechanosensitive channel